MLNKLQQRWKVNGINLLLIIATFALGGSLCGYAGRRVLLLSGMDKGLLWVICYILLLTILWPICVLLVSIPLGQFSFFSRYIARILSKIRGKTADPGSETITRIAIFASGAGSNADNIINYFKPNKFVDIRLIVCNNPLAGVKNIAKIQEIELLMINKASFFDPAGCLAELQKKGINLIILAGFLWKVPPVIIRAFAGRIINIHPALLPLYGGKGMYGRHVHEAVLANREKQSGITIHLADDVYDHGQVLFQATCPVSEDETPDSLANKIHLLEHKHFPEVIDAFIKKQNHS